MPGVQLVNVHALGGTAMLEAGGGKPSALVFRWGAGPHPADCRYPFVPAWITRPMREAGIAGTPAFPKPVKLGASRQKNVGVDGSCGPQFQEAKSHSQKRGGREFLIVTPGRSSRRKKSGDKKKKTTKSAQLPLPQQAHQSPGGGLHRGWADQSSPQKIPEQQPEPFVGWRSLQQNRFLRTPI